MNVSSQVETKVAHVLYSGLGGHASVVFSLLKAGGAKSWKNILFFLGIEGISTNHVEFCESAGLSFSYVEAIERHPLRSWVRLYKGLQREKPDIVLLHSVSAVVPSWLYAKSSGARLIVVEHQANGLKRFVDWVFSAASSLFADKVIVLTNQYLAEVKEKLGMFFLEAKYSVVHTGIDTQVFYPSLKEFDNSRQLILGMAARFVRSKRHDTLIRVLYDLRSRDHEVNWMLSLPGVGGTYEQVLELADSLDIKNSILLPGLLDEADLANWFRSIDFYVHASDGETLSTALLQAMATGRPIIASDVQGIRNLLTASGPCGLLVNNQNVSGFPEAITLLLSDEALRKSLPEHGMHLVKTHYNLQSMFEGYCRAMFGDGKPHLEASN